MITDANGMPVLQPLIDDASTATFNTAFGIIGQTFKAFSGTRMTQNFRWANQAEQDAQAGMVDGDTGFRTDTGKSYRRYGNAWVFDVMRISASSGKTGPRPAGAVPILQTGRFAAPTNGSGVLPLCPFDFTFPGGVSSIQLTSGQGAAAAPVLNADTMTTASFGAIIPSAPNANVVIYWTAIGW